MTLREINDMAETIARKYNPDKLAPFPFDAITDDKKDLNVILVDLDDDNVSGVILYDEQERRFSILINSTKHSNRQNFTVGHELGHYFLHQEILKADKGFIDGDKALDNGNVLYRLDNADQDKLETEANHFAASLLMPSSLVKEAWEITGDVEKCARIFQVSVIAMSIRLTELELVD